MSYSGEKFLWTDALRLMLIKEVKRRPIIWSSINDIKNEWKCISNECVRVLNRNDEFIQTESSIWRFGYVLKFMLHAITDTEEGNACALLYLNKLNIFCIVRENDIVGVLWPFSNVNIRLKGKFERAMVIEVGQHRVIIEKCKHKSFPENLCMIPNDKFTEVHMLPHKLKIQPRRYTGSLMRRDDEVVYYDSGAYSDKENSVKNAPILLRMPDVGESKPFSALQLLIQNQTFPKRHLFYGISSSALAHVDSELHKKREQYLQSELSSCSRPTSQCPAIASFTESQHDTDSTFPVGFSRTPSRVTKLVKCLNYNWGRLCRRLDNIRCEADGLRSMVVVAKRDIDSELKTVMLRLLSASEPHVPTVVPACGSACEKEMKAVLVQTDKVFNEENGFFHIGKFYADEVYRYCPKEFVHGLVATCSHPTAFARCLARHIFTREEISMLFSENMTISQIERIRWIEIMISTCYPRKQLSSLYKSCLQALCGLADYENLLLELEKENHSLDNSGRSGAPVKRMRLDDACSSTHEKYTEENELEGDYLLPQTLSRIRRQQQNAEGFAVKVALLLYSGTDDIQKPCKEKRNQAKVD
ncbi:hypothetical protein WUBG_07864 [Wuchereria bancrofti]|uniref:MADF domain-containing protein n=1 Tax=Wuchereria bancrofti TaxID=6293 RepID=J9EGD7_WUCBA|nr:hypothetical protein WUBG_07864 [Wuchereria bancrofti]